MSSINGSVAVPKWVLTFLVPMVLLIGAAAVAFSDIKALKVGESAHEDRIDMLEQNAILQADDHMRLLRMEEKQKEIAETMAEIRSAVKNGKVSGDK